MTRIAVVNCNTTESMTAAIAARAQAAAGPGTEIIGVTPSWGVESAEGWYDSFISAAAVLHALGHLDGSVDGVVLAGFGEHGREGAREILQVPVVDITEAAAHIAMPLGRRGMEVRGRVLETWLRGERVASYGDGVTVVAGELIRRG